MRKHRPFEPEYEEEKAPWWFTIVIGLLASFAIGWLLWDINETLRDLEGWWK